MHIYITKRKTMIRTSKKDDLAVSHELVEEMKEIEKEPVIVVKDLRKHFED